MPKKNFIWIVIGSFFTLIILFLILLTLFYIEIIIKYNGLFTFLSLFTLILLFFMEILIKHSKEKQDQEKLLRAIGQKKEIIKDNLSYFEKSLTSSNVPIHKISHFKIDAYLPKLNKFFKRKSTSNLIKMLFCSNHEIETLNSIRDKIWDGVWHPTNFQKKNNNSKKLENEFNNQINKQIKISIDKLKHFLNKIEINLKKFEID
jgi:hypothetical protein